MNPRLIGWLTITTLLFSVLWLSFFITGLVITGPLDTLDSAITYAARHDTLFYLTYLNAVLVTLSCTFFMAGLYSFVRESIPTGAMIGLLFLPIYAVINLSVYFTQITIVPGLASTTPTSEGTLLLSLLLQSWPRSGAAFFNNLAYGILGIPSTLFGMVLWRSSFPLRYGGGLLVLNGIACILGVVGLLTGSAFLSFGSLAGGVLFILSLPFIALGMLK